MTHELASDFSRQADMAVADHALEISRRMPPSHISTEAATIELGRAIEADRVETAKDLKKGPSWSPRNRFANGSHRKIAENLLNGNRAKEKPLTRNEKLLIQDQLQAIWEVSGVRGRNLWTELRRTKTGFENGDFGRNYATFVGELFTRVCEDKICLLPRKEAKPQF